MVAIKQIKLTNLLINTENYRFIPVLGQRKAIEQMVEDQGDKLYKLAEHISKNGLNPNDKVQVAPSSHEAPKFNVLEGNRRIVVLKILHNPDLLDFDGQASLRKRFKKLHDEYKSKRITDIECTVYDDPSEAEEWIKLKHTGENEGVGIVAWDAQQKQRFEEKVEGKSSIALQAVKLLHASPNVPREIKEQLGDLKITNLDRLISDPAVRDMLGLEIHNGQLQSDVDKKEVVKCLTKIAKDLLDPRFNVKKIYTKVDRKEYIDKFPKSSKPNIKSKSSSKWQIGDTSGVLSSKRGPKKGSKRVRRVLIPKTCVMSINNPKVDTIFRELQKLHVDNYKNAAAVLFRVFVELSMDCFIGANKVPKASLKSKLRVKVGEVSSYLERNNLADRHICKGIRSAVNNPNDLLGVDTWHAYVHNPRFSPTPQNLMTTWDNMQDFMERVWGNIQ